MLALAIEKHRAGHLAAAESLYDQVLTVDPNNVQALNLLGLLRLQCDQTNGCIELIRKSLMVDTDQSGLGRTLGELCDSPALLLKLGTVFSELRRDADALAASGKAVALGPTLPHACSSTVSCYRTTGTLRKRCRIMSVPSRMGTIQTKSPPIGTVSARRLGTRGGSRMPCALTKLFCLTNRITSPLT